MSDESHLTPEREEEIRLWLAGRIRRHRRRRRAFTVGGVATGGVAALALVAWMVVAPQEVQDRWVDCYSAVDTNAPYATAARSNVDSVEDRNAMALAVCQELWRQGLVDGSTHDDAPEFALCQRTDLSLAAFPRPAEESSAAVCEQVGMTPPTR